MHIIFACNTIHYESTTNCFFYKQPYIVFPTERKYFLQQGYLLDYSIL